MSEITGVSDDPIQNKKYKKRHEHCGVDPNLECVICLRMHVHMLIVNAMEGIEASVIVRKHVVKILELDQVGKRAAMNLTPAEIQRRRDQGRKMGLNQQRKRNKAIEEELKG